MRLHRFITEYKQIRNRIIITDTKVVHQMMRVFRLGTDDRVIICDNDYRDHVCKITSTKGGKIELEEESVETCPHDHSKIIIGLCLIKKDLFEYAVQKLVEVGVTDIVPLFSRRTLKTKLPTERLQEIMREATEQSGRGKIPILHPSQTVEEFLSKGNSGKCAIADFDGEVFSEVFGPKDHVRTILIGPEGGWDDKERALFREYQISIISLGESVLRAETAAVVAGWCAKNI